MYTKSLLLSLLMAISAPTLAQWEEVNNVDYTWGPFKIYNITLFSENGSYQPSSRPLMLTIKYEKAVDGRDFAIGLSKAWDGIGIQLEHQDDVIDHLKKSLPDLKPNDSFSYIALADRGYFVLNDTVLGEEYSAEINDAILATWLNEKSEFLRSHPEFIVNQQAADSAPQQAPVDESGNVTQSAEQESSTPPAAQ